MNNLTSLESLPDAKYSKDNGLQVVGVLDAMPASNLKPEAEDGILEEDRVYRTTYMFSATMPPPVERLARKYMRRPAVINIGSAGKATDNVTQKACLLPCVPVMNRALS